MSRKLEIKQMNKILTTFTKNDTGVVYVAQPRLFRDVFHMHKRRHHKDKSFLIEKAGVDKTSGEFKLRITRTL